MVKRWVKVKTYLTAKHYWKNAPEQVKFLRYPHLHTFHITVMIEVEEKDREIEFFMLLDHINMHLQPLQGTTFQWSCEDLCDYVYKGAIRPYYKGRDVKIEVSEDGLNGAITEYSKGEENE